MYFYSDAKSENVGNVDIWRMNGTTAYVNHYDNLLFLQFILHNPLSSEVERRQARKEMEICEKKLEFWRRHPNYVHEEALRRVNDLKKNWQQQGVAA